MSDARRRSSATALDPLMDLLQDRTDALTPLVFRTSPLLEMALMRPLVMSALMPSDDGWTGSRYRPHRSTLSKPEKATRKARNAAQKKARKITRMKP